MPEIQAFRAIRYDLGHVGSLSEVVAPPYDVIDPTLQDALYKQHPANVIRLILNRDEPGDEPQSRYQRAAKYFRQWQSEGLLFTEGEPALYVYHQVFDYAGQTWTRRGFMARVRLERFGEGSVYPHEETMSGPKADRLMLTRACRANLSQVFGLYPDPQQAAQQRLEEAIAGQAPLEATDHLGVVHRLWPVTDVDTIAAVTGLVGSQPVFIADGHHRYETACNYRDELAAAGPLDREHPANFVLMMCVSMSDPGMIVLPTHRIIRGLPGLTAESLRERLAGAFTTRILGEGTDLADSAWQQLQADGDQGTLALYTAADGRWVLARMTDEGRSQMARAASDHGAAWQGLGVAILHRLVLETLLEARDLPKPTYVHLVDEVVRELDEGQYDLAALVLPPTLDEIRIISEERERMPAKSTYFYPKLLSGLVFNPLE